jgi:hypothetical protein
MRAVTARPTARATRRPARAAAWVTSALRETSLPPAAGAARRVAYAGPARRVIPVSACAAARPLRMRAAVTTREETDKSSAAAHLGRPSSANGTGLHPRGAPGTASGSWCSRDRSARRAAEVLRPNGRVNRRSNIGTIRDLKGELVADERARNLSPDSVGQHVPAPSRGPVAASAASPHFEEQLDGFEQYT